MKKFLFTLFILSSMLTIAQTSGTIQGRITDAEIENAPLLYAKVSIKETGVKVMTDENGAFKFGNLANGTYTLVCSFTGYETKEIKTEVNSKNTNAIVLTLMTSSLSLDDLTSVYASSNSNKNDKG